MNTQQHFTWRYSCLGGGGWGRGVESFADGFRVNGVGVSTLACMTAGDCDRSDIELCLRERVPWMPGRRALESLRVSGPLGPSPACGPRDPPPPPPGCCPRGPPPPPPPGLIISCRTELWSRASVTSLRDLDSYTANGMEHIHIKFTLTFEFNFNQHLYIYGDNKKCTSLEPNFLLTSSLCMREYATHATRRPPGPAAFIR